jgi:hypothetical protein
MISSKRRNVHQIIRIIEMAINLANLPRASSLPSFTVSLTHVCLSCTIHAWFVINNMVLKTTDWLFLETHTWRDFVAVPQARKKLLIGGRSLGCPGGIEVCIAGSRGRGPWPKSQNSFLHIFFRFDEIISFRYFVPGFRGNCFQIKVQMRVWARIISSFAGCVLGHG